MSRKRAILLLVLLLAAGAGTYAYRRMGTPALVLTGIVTTNDVIVSPQIAGQIGQLLVTEGDAVKRDQLAREGRALSAEEDAALREPIVEQYEREGSPYYSTARLWDDGILDPVDTRQALALGLSMAFNAPIPEPHFNGASRVELAEAR